MAPPVTSVPGEEPIKGFSRGMSRFNGVFALLRIKPHAPPLVQVPVNSQSFILANVLPGGILIAFAAAPMSFAHQHLVFIVYAWTTRVSNPVAPHAFEPQRQLLSSKPPSPPVFFLISTHFHRTRNSALPLQHSSNTVSKAVSVVEPGYFTSDLRRRLRSFTPSKSG